MWFLSAEGGKDDRITLDGEEFIVCDSTYINAGVGMAMLGLIPHHWGQWRCDRIFFVKIGAGFEKCL